MNINESAARLGPTSYVDVYFWICVLFSLVRVSWKYSSRVVSVICHCTVCTSVCHSPVWRHGVVMVTVTLSSNYSEFDVCVWPHYAGWRVGYSCAMSIRRFRYFLHANRKKQLYGDNFGSPCILRSIIHDVARDMSPSTSCCHNFLTFSVARWSSYVVVYVAHKASEFHEMSKYSLLEQTPVRTTKL